MKNTYTLIIGGAGFVGSHLSEKLLSLHENILCFDNFSSQNTNYEKNLANIKHNDRFTIIKGDITVIEAIEAVFREYEIDKVVHLAAFTGVRDSMEMPDDCIKQNITGLLNVLKTMQHYHVKNIVFASSSSVYGNRHSTMSEKDPTNTPLSVYSSSKLTGEHLLSCFAANYGIHAIVLRLFNVYGPRQRESLVIHKFFNQISEKQTITIYDNGEQQRDFTFISDVVNAFVATLRYFDHPNNNGNNFEIINVCNNNPVSVNQLLIFIKSTINQTEYNEIQYAAASKSDIKYSKGKNNKAKKLLGWRPRVSIQSGLNLFYHWYITKS